MYTVCTFLSVHHRTVLERLLREKLKNNISPLERPRLQIKLPRLTHFIVLQGNIDYFRTLTYQHEFVNFYHLEQYSKNKTYKVGVYFISYNWHFVATGHVKNVFEMLFGIHRTTGVWRIVDHNCSCTVVDERFQVIEIYLPWLFWLKHKCIVSPTKLLKGKFLKYQTVNEFHMMAHKVDAFRNKLQGLKCVLIFVKSPAKGIRLNMNLKFILVFLLQTSHSRLAVNGITWSVMQIICKCTFQSTDPSDDFNMLQWNYS